MVPGCDLHEPLPDHSSLTRIRERYGLEVFRRFFDQIVEMCVEAGLVWGEELFVDPTTVRANAAKAALVPRFAMREHLDELFGEQTSPRPTLHVSPAVRGKADLLPFQTSNLATYCSSTCESSTSMKRRLGSLVSAREKGTAIRRPFGEVANRDLGVPDGPATEDVIDRVATAGSDGVFVRGSAS